MGCCGNGTDLYQHDTYYKNQLQLSITSNIQFVVSDYTGSTKTYTKGTLRCPCVYTTENAKVNSSVDIIRANYEMCESEYIQWKTATVSLVNKNTVNGSEKWTVNGAVVYPSTVKVHYCNDDNCVSINKVVSVISGTCVNLETYSPFECHSDWKVYNKGSCYVKYTGAVTGSCIRLYSDIYVYADTVCGETVKVYYCNDMTCESINKTAVVSGWTCVDLYEKSPFIYRGNWKVYGEADYTGDLDS